MLNSTPETGADQNMLPECGVAFMAPISGAGFWLYVMSLASFLIGPMKMSVVFL